MVHPNNNVGISRWAQWIGVLVILVQAAPSVQAVQTLTEYEVKAVFLLNFTRYITWPDSAFEDADAPFVIGVVGENPFGNVLDQITSTRKANGRPIQIRWHKSRVDQLGKCHILFVPSSESRRAGQIIELLHNSHTLTVGEQPDFLDLGGAINFVLRGESIRLQIAMEPTAEAGLTVSSALMGIAETVRRE